MTPQCGITNIMNLFHCSDSLSVKLFNNIEVEAELINAETLLSISSIQAKKEVDCVVDLSSSANQRNVGTRNDLDRLKIIFPTLPSMARSYGSMMSNYSRTIPLMNIPLMSGEPELTPLLIPAKNGVLSVIEIQLENGIYPCPTAIEAALMNKHNDIARIIYKKLQEVGTEADKQYAYNIDGINRVIDDSDDLIKVRESAHEDFDVVYDRGHTYTDSSVTAIICCGIGVTLFGAAAVSYCLSGISEADDVDTIGQVCNI